MECENEMRSSIKEPILAVNKGFHIKKTFQEINFKENKTKNMQGPSIPSNYIQNGIANDQKALERFERRLLRRILVPFRVGEDWKGKTNKEQEDLAGKRDIVKCIKPRELGERDMSTE